MGMSNSVMSDIADIGILRRLKDAATMDQLSDGILPETPVVVVDENRLPLVVLSRTSFDRGLDPKMWQRLLAGDPPDWHLPVITTPDTPIRAGWLSIAYEGIPIWHVVMVDSDTVGVVSPFKLLRMLVREDPEEEILNLEWLTTLQRGSSQPWFHLLPGNPIHPRPGICYRCRRHPEDAFGPQDVRRRDPVGNPLCPIDLSVMVFHNPCS